MDVAVWSAIIGPITTLLGGLGGYWLAGRNEEGRDRRAASREEAARRNALAERLEESRHGFQRDALLELQDELQRLVRSATQITLQDRRTIKESGQTYLLAEDLSDQAMEITVSVQRLRSRVLDDELRASIGVLIDLCSSAGVSLIEYPQGKVPDDERDQALAKLDRQIMHLAEEYSTVTEAVGKHLRSELDRRGLAAPSNS
ncbi:hypothetical protein [Kribbella sp. NPDC051770]|uniref:hypothetical protein n=1 Tax=Kribbella sp. NPDC051770 TaxID=3155413 RepID=UPI00343401AC